MNQPIKITCILALSLLINSGISASEASSNVPGHAANSNLPGYSTGFKKSKNSEKQTPLVTKPTDNSSNYKNYKK